MHYIFDSRFISDDVIMINKWSIFSRSNVDINLATVF